MPARTPARKPAKPKSKKPELAAPAPAVELAVEHGRSFSAFVYNLLSRRVTLAPSGASTAALAEAFTDSRLLATLSQILTTFALQTLLKNLSPAQTKVVLPNGEVLRAHLWDPPLTQLMPQGIHSQFLGVAAQLFLVSSRLTSEAKLSLQIEGELATDYKAKQAAILHEAENAAAIAKSPWPWARSLATCDVSLEGLAHCPPGRFGVKGEPQSFLDFVLMDGLLDGARDISASLKSSVGELAKYWSGTIDRALDVSPLTQLLGLDSEIIPPPDKPARSAERIRATLEPLFQNNNHLFIRFIEGDLVTSWIRIEKARIEANPLGWIELNTRFVSILMAFMKLAADSRLVSVLTVIPRFYGQVFRTFPGEAWSARVMRGMRGLVRMTEKQAFMDAELRFFQPLLAYDEVVQRIRLLNWAERTPDEEFLASDPLSQTAGLMDNYRFLVEKLQLANIIAQKR